MENDIQKQLPADVFDEITIAEQQHVLSYFLDGDYSKEDVEFFVKQCRSFDLIRARNLYTNSILHNQIISRVYSEMKESPETFTELKDLPEDICQKYRDTGLGILADGKTALVLLTGGQASRLQISKVKGNADFGLPSHSTLFKRIFYNIRHIQDEVKAFAGKEVQLPIYVMTSEFNRQEIESNIHTLFSMLYSLMILFLDSGYYGLDKNQITFFHQGSFPCVDSNGDFVMREKHRIALSPDGSGGLFMALHRNHIIDEWVRKGISRIHVFGIDNACELPADPVFLGYSVIQQTDVCLKCVEKCCPEERLSVLAQYAERPLLAIHSEMNYRQIIHRDEDGELVFRYGFIFDTIFTLDFILQHCQESSLPLYCHVVKKAIPYYDSILNRTIKPITPNAYKMEYYLSDVFPNATNLKALVVSRDEYAPLKNPMGKPIASPEKVVEHVTSQHLRFLLQAGAILEGVTEEDTNLVEISPLISAHGEGLESFSGVRMKLPCCVLDESEVDLKMVKNEAINNRVRLLYDRNGDYYQYVLLRVSLLFLVSSQTP